MFQITCFVADKDLGEVFKRLVGIAKNLEHKFVPNVESKRNGKAYQTAEDSKEAFMNEIRKRKLETLKATDAKAIVESLGYSPTSYSHFLQQMCRAHLLKKGKKDGIGMTYHVVK
jgi:hypothetical protein